MARRLKTATLSESMETFALTYLNNGMNATAAYKLIHPNTNQRTAEVQASRLLRKPEVEALLDRERKARRKRLQMDGDEALEGITRMARGRPQSLFKDGRLLPIADWPEDGADCVKSIKRGPHGFELTFYDKLKARELMAINAGKIKQRIDARMTFDHAAYLGAEPPPGDEE